MAGCASDLTCMKMLAAAKCSVKSSKACVVNFFGGFSQTIFRKNYPVHQTRIIAKIDGSGMRANIALLSV